MYDYVNSVKSSENDTLIKVALKVQIVKVKVYLQFKRNCYRDTDSMVLVKGTT